MLRVGCRLGRSASLNQVRSLVHRADANSQGHACLTPTVGTSKQEKSWNHEKHEITRKNSNSLMFKNTIRPRLVFRDLS